MPPGAFSLTGRRLLNGARLIVTDENAAPNAAQIQLTGVRQRATLWPVNIRNFVHKGLKRLYVEDSAKGLPADAVDKLRTMLTFLQDMQDPERLRAFPLWKAHLLAGDRKGV
jgi:hypothetical protein